MVTLEFHLSQHSLLFLEGFRLPLSVTNDLMDHEQMFASVMANA